MPLHIENRGSGFIGELGANWRISQNGSPMVLGQSAGRLGSLSFSAQCDKTTKFTIDNYLSVKHYYDNSVDRWLSTFDGYVRSVEIDNGFAQFSMTSILSALDVERTTSANPSGTYQRTLEVPVGMEYTISGTTYTVGGYWTSVGSENIFVPRPANIWDIAASQDFVYALVSGSHLGEVVIVYDLDGTVRNIWPVYSDATDLSSPESKYISYTTGYVFIGQVNAHRVKKFQADGTFTLQFGSAGTGDGQFDTISGVAVNDSGINAVYVTDSVLGRVQWFTETGTFGNKWGTSGTGAGNAVFNGPNGVSVDPLTQNVLVSDRNARVRAYTSGGTYVSEVMGKYDFDASKSIGEFVAGNYYIKTAFDHLGNAYAIQLGKVFKYVRNTTSWTSGPGVPVQTWDTNGIDDLSQPSMLTIHHTSGVIHVARSHDKIEQWSGSLGRVVEYALYYIGLASPDFPIRMLNLNEEYAVGELAYIEWTGNVWEQLSQMCAATGNAMYVFDDKLVFVARAIKTFNLPDDIVVEPLSLDSRGSGQYVEIVNQNARHTSGWEVMYSAEADNDRTFNIDVGEFNRVIVNQDTYPEYLNQPTPSTAILDGQYIVVDSDDTIVSTSRWTYYGGKITAEHGERHGDIAITIYGPRYPVPGYNAPYKISTPDGHASLSIIGSGIISKPEVIRIGTGVSESVNSREVAESIDSPFAWNAATAYTEGSWVAYNSGTPNQEITIRIKTNFSYSYHNSASGGILGTATMLNTIIKYDDAQYIVDQLEWNSTEIVLTCYRYTMAGITAGDGGISGGQLGEQSPPRPEEIWGGRTAAEFDAFWGQYTGQDFAIAPLMNPYGV